MTVKCKFIRISLFTMALLAGSVSFAQVCTSVDQRASLEQLDCFCSSEGKSVVQEKVENVGPLAETFGLVNSSTCTSAVSHLLAFSEEASIESNVSSRLSELGFSSEKSSVILSDAKKKADLIKSILSGGGIGGLYSSSGFSMSIGTDGFKFEVKRGGRAVNPEGLDSHEMLEIYKMALEIQVNGVSVSSMPFTNLFKKIERAAEIVARYPENRISSCLEVTDDLEKIGQCLDSSSSIEKIDGCVGLNMITSSTLQCLNTKADVAQLRACGELNMIASSTLDCLNKDAQPEIIRACERLNMISSSTNNCISSGATTDKIAACGRLNMIASNTLDCIYSNAAVDVVDACGDLNMIGSNTLSCIRSGASSQKIRNCGDLNLIGSKTIQCIRQ